nr:CoA transferase [Thermaerobacter marianensis]
MAEAAHALAAPLRHGLTAPGGLLGGGLPLYRCYPARDGWVAVAALEPHFARRLLDELGPPGPGLPPGVEERLAAVFRRRPAAEWEAWARQRDLPLAAVRTGPGSGPAPAGRRRLTAPAPCLRREEVTRPDRRGNQPAGRSATPMSHTPGPAPALGIRGRPPREEDPSCCRDS